MTLDVYILVDVSCSLPKCDEGCLLNYEAKPCPACDCTGSKYLFFVHICLTYFINLPYSECKRQVFKCHNLMSSSFTSDSLFMTMFNLSNKFRLIKEIIFENYFFKKSGFV